MALDEINQYPITTTSLDDLAFFDVDNYKSLAYKSERVPMSVMNAQFRVNLGNNNLIADGDYSYTLFGSLASNTVTFKNAATSDIIQFRGDNSVYIPTGAVGHGMTPNAIIQYRLGGTHGFAYGLYVDGTYSVAGVRVLSTSAPNKFTCSNIGNNQIGYNSEGNTAATANRTAHRAYINGTNTAANIGFTCDVTNGANNYALNIIDGDIRFGSGVSAGSMIGTLTTEKFAFWNTTPITQPTALTAADATATDGTIGTADTIINNLRVRVDELEARLSTSGGGVGLFA